LIRDEHIARLIESTSTRSMRLMDTRCEERDCLTS
jgi:hypothetical protein